MDTSSIDKICALDPDKIIGKLFEGADKTQGFKALSEWIEKLGEAEKNHPEMDYDLIYQKTAGFLFDVVQFELNASKNPRETLKTLTPHLAPYSQAVSFVLTFLKHSLPKCDDQQTKQLFTLFSGAQNPVKPCLKCLLAVMDIKSLENRLPIEIEKNFLQKFFQTQKYKPLFSALLNIDNTLKASYSFLCAQAWFKNESNTEDYYF